MGVYNTFVSDESFFCSVCGGEYKDTQEYDLGYAQFYEIGDKVKEVSSKCEGNTIAERSFICLSDKCKEKKKRMFDESVPFDKCYIVIENYIFIGITFSLFLAKYLLDFRDYFFDEE